MSKNKEIFLKKHAPIISLADVWNDPRYSVHRQAYEARLKRREKLIERMKSRTAKEAAQCLIFGLAFWGAILAAAEFGMKGTEGLGEGTKAQRQKALGHDFHAPAKLPHQRASTLRSVFHTVPAPWRTKAGLFIDH